MRKRVNIVAVGVVVGGLLTGCGSGDGGDSESVQRPAREKPLVFTVNYPLQYFAQRIGGDAVDVVFPAPADVDPAHWMPDRKTVKAYQQADLILRNGADYAKWLDKVSLPESRLIDTSAAFKAQLLKVEDVVTHSHGRGGEHSHVGTASHTWLNPRLAVMQAEAIRDALVGLAPGKAGEFEANFDSLKTDLLELDAAIDASIKQDRDRPVVFSHPVFQYFQQRFAVNSRTLDLDPWGVPETEELDKHKKLQAGHRYDRVIWHAGPGDGQSKELLRVGIKSYSFQLCSNAPETGDYLTVMQSNVKELKQAYRPVQ